MKKRDYAKKDGAERTGKGRSRLQVHFHTESEESLGVTYRAVSGDTLLDTVESVTDAGGAIQFGRTRDGGALAVAIYDEGEREVFYVGPGGDLAACLARIRGYFGSASR